MFDVDSGRIEFDGVDITRVPSRHRIGHGIARSFQNIRLMPHLSALDNVIVGQHCRNRGIRGVLQPISLVPRNRWREEARAALADAGLGEHERSTVGSLPYGVQKRIELVRALMAHPRLLLLDEPAAGLNPAETEAAQAQLEKICDGGGVTLMVVEHDMQFIGALCQHVIVLDFGRKIAEGTPDEIRQNPLGPRNLSRRSGNARQGDPHCCLKCVIWMYATAASMRCERFRWTLHRARSLPCWAQTAPANRRCCAHCLVSSSLTGGSVAFNGHDITHWPTSRRVRQGLVLVPEGRRIVMNLTVHENLLMGAFHRRDSGAVAKEIDGIYQRFPNLASRRHNLASVLSGGEQQMLAIGRGLLAAPKVMMLDEPSLGPEPDADE